jgi:predicted ABC-type ATPase
LQGLADAEAVNAGQHKIQQDNIRQHFARKIESVVAVARFKNREPLVLKGI